MIPHSLDPDDWAPWERAWQRAATLAVTHIRALEANPVWTPTPDAVKATYQEPLNEEPLCLDGLMTQFEKTVLPYANGNLHPRFFGWVHGGGNVQGALGEACAALLNSNLGGRDHSGVYLERQVIDWAKAWFDYPKSASGLLVSGTSMASLLALTIARDRAGIDPRWGLQSTAPRLVGYGSEQTHHSVVKAFRVLGLGDAAFHEVRSDASFRLDPNAVRAQIHADRKAGLRPFVVVANLGTVNTGAIDDIEALALLCRTEGVWLHVDAAFGAAIALLPDADQKRKGLSLADSIAFDFHKWFQVPYAVGCLLVRDEKAHKACFSTRKNYLLSDSIGLAGGEPWFCDYGIELSRGFLALKVWFTLKSHGVKGIRAVVKKHCGLAQALAARIRACSALEQLAPVSLNIVCFRFIGTAKTTDTALDALNEWIIRLLALRGIAAPSSTRIGGVLAIRVGFFNHRTQHSDIDVLIDAVLELGSRLQNTLASWITPLFVQLMSGGDARLQLDEATGLNRYGCAPYPRPEAFTFASSTATSVSDYAYLAAQQKQRECIEEGLETPLSTIRTRLTQQIVARLVAVLGLPPDAVDVHLSPSGTDSQLHAVAAITASDKTAHWVSLVYGADETGKGTPLSVTGCHFDDVSALGITQTKGTRLAQMPKITYEPLFFYDQTGKRRPQEALDHELENRVAHALNTGAKVILHGMDQSKLGMSGPSRTVLDGLRTHNDGRLFIVVDACQLRIDREDIAYHITKGDWVLITGSKFFTGPPFSGACLIPSSFYSKLKNSESLLPAGLAQYIAQEDLGRWAPALPNAITHPGLGLALRWWAALEEMERYYQIPAARRKALIALFCSRLTEKLMNCPVIEPLFFEQSPFQTEEGAELSGRRTVFPFFVKGRNGRLSPAQVQQLYHFLNADISAEAPDGLSLSPAEKQWASQPCHIGQPVHIAGMNTAILRISLGARVVSQCNWLTDAHALEKIEDELLQIDTILQKIQLCIQWLAR
jgi:glutamate/tyrosine decarboxylase-like PLP-dependent enzyme